MHTINKIDKLTPAQHQAAMSILRTLTSHNSDSCQAVLAGYAGVGKSFTVGAIAQVLVNKGYEVVGITHSHKALAVLRASLPTSVTTKTVYNALGWRIAAKSGATEKTGRTTLYGTDVLIVDECSMIDTQMYKAITKLAKALNFAILWVGDPAQLPPVGHEAAIPPVFVMVEKQYRLTEIVRQAKDSPIIKASMYLRECLEKGEYPDIDTLQIRAGKDAAMQIVTGGITTVAEYAISALNHDLDTRVIAYTNKAVSRTNSIIAHHYHPSGSLLFVAGDPITFGTAYRRQEVTLAGTDERGRVISATLLDGNHGALDLPCLRVTLRLEGGNDLTVNVPTDVVGYGNELRRMKSLRTKYLAHARSEAHKGDYQAEAEATEKALQIGVVIDRCTEDYADLRHDYALTAHKAQGSTFEVVVLDYKDIQTIKDVSILCRLLYVAITRPSKFLIICC